MRFAVVVMFMMMFMPSAHAQGYCSTCNNKGYIVVFPQVAHFGVETTKKQCPYCKKWVFSGHTEKCPTCKGDGRNRPGYNKPKTRADEIGEEATADLITYLTTAEYNTLQGLYKALMPQPVAQNCNSCNGSGKCVLCGGAMTFNFELNTACLACGGSGVCAACGGRRTNGNVQMREPQNKEQIIQNIKYYHNLARQRKEAGGR